MHGAVDLPEPVDFEWPLESDRADAEVLRRAGRDPAAPVAPAEVSAIVRQIVGRLREEFGRFRMPDGLEQRLAELEKDFEPHRKFGKWVAGLAATAIVGTGYFLYHRGADEQHITDQIQTLTETVHRLERHLEPNQKDPRQ